MNSSISGSSTRGLFLRLVLPAVTALLVVVGLNAGLLGLGLKPRLKDWGKTLDDYNVIYTSALKAKESGKRVVAFIGDSRIEWGIDPEELQGVLQQEGVRDVEVYNLALPGRNVRTILARLNEVQFYPDVLIVGYSHLSFYWSKNFVKQPPQRLGWWEMDRNRLNSFVRRKILVSSYRPTAVWTYVRRRLGGERPRNAGGSWLDRIDVTPRGQARVHYKISAEEAVGFQKKFYAKMYEVEISKDAISDINRSFLMDITALRENGSKVLLLKMPLSRWALELEEANERTGLSELADYLGTPFWDANRLPGARALQSFDGLHLTPSAAAKFSRPLADKFIRPNL